VKCVLFVCYLLETLDSSYLFFHLDHDSSDFLFSIFLNLLFVRWLNYLGSQEYYRIHSTASEF